MEICACYAPWPEVGDGEVKLQCYKTVTVSGQQVTALLDSGRFMSLVRQDLIPVSSRDYSRQEDILCVHGDRNPYPTADLTVSNDEQPHQWGIPESRFCENSEFVNPEMRETLSFQFQKGR